jgi:hypothetical protein
MAFHSLASIPGRYCVQVVVNAYAYTKFGRTQRDHKTLASETMRTLQIAFCAALIGLSGCRATVTEVATASKEVVILPFQTTLIVAALGAAAYYVIDPLAPNWEVAQKQVGDTRYRIDLRLKRFHSGGEGEAEPLFKRHAEELAENIGTGEYRVIAYTEGIDSNVTGPQRWSRGIIELPPDKTSAAGN